MTFKWQLEAFAQITMKQKLLISVRNLNLITKTMSVQGPNSAEGTSKRRHEQPTQSV
jgi:hypothetical protein